MRRDSAVNGFHGCYAADMPNFHADLGVWYPIRTADSDIIRPQAMRRDELLDQLLLIKSA